MVTLCLTVVRTFFILCCAKTCKKFHRNCSDVECTKLLISSITPGTICGGSELASIYGTVGSCGNIFPHNSRCLQFHQVRWTPYFTADRMKTLLRTTREVSLTISYHDFTGSVREIWNYLDPYFSSRLSGYFGPYKYYVFLHALCHLERKYVDKCRYSDSSFPMFVFPVHRFCQVKVFYFERLYTSRSSLENAFTYSVLNVDLASSVRFYTLLRLEKRRENMILVTNTFLTRLADLEFILQQSKFKIVSTFLFLWHELEDCDRFQIVQNNFKQYYHLVVSFPGTDSLVRYVDWYRPSGGIKENREYLLKAVAGTSKNILGCEKNRRVFRVIYNKIGTMMSEIDVVNLLETLLTVRDIDSSVIVMKKMDFQKKNKLMNVLHKIWNDLWKDSIDIETFMTFFIEIQSHMIQLVDDANIR